MPENQRTPADNQNYSKFKKVFIVSVTLVLLGVCFSSIYALQMINRANFSVAEQQLRSNAVIIKGNIKTLISSLDSSLIAIADRIVLTDCIDECLQPILFHQKSSYEMLRVLLVVNAEGIVTAESRNPTKAVGIDVSDRPYFKTHLAASERKLFIGPPNRSRVNNEWSMPISRAIYAADGKLKAVIVASIEPQYFNQLMQPAVLDPDSGDKSFIKHLEITLDDTTVLASYPHRDDIIGKTLDTPSYLDLTKESYTNFYVSTHLPLQGGSIIQHSSLAPEYPLHLFITGWPEKLNQTFINTVYRWGGILCILLLLVVYLTRIGLRYSEQSIIQTIELSENEEKFRTLFENLAQGILYQKADGKLVDVNQSALDIFGLTRENFLSRDSNTPEWKVIDENFSDLKPDEHPSIVALRTGKPVKNKIAGVFNPKKNKFIWLSINAIPQFRKGEEEPFQVFVSLHDITERKEIEQEQISLRRQLEAVWKISQMVDDQLEIICNHVLSESTKLTQSQYGFYGFLNETGDTVAIYSWSHEAMEDCRVEGKCLQFPLDKSGIWANSIRDKKPFFINDYQQECPHKKGIPEGHVPLSRVLSVPVIIDDQVVAIGAVANKKQDYTQDDVTILQSFLNNIQLVIDKKSDKAALLKAHEELEQRVEVRTKELQETHAQLLHAEKLSAIGNLSASIAHEFNNPLAGITNIIHGLKKRATYDEDDAQLIDMALKECARIKNLIRCLQDFNRPSSGKFVLMDIHPTIDSLLLLSKKEFKTRGITIQTNYAVNMPQIIAIADQVKQVILNLLNNAAYACEGGGTIRIDTFVVDDSVEIKIADNGQGIKPEHIDHIFEPFFSTKPEVKGTGLGLSISYGIIKNHGGKILVESTPGKGSTFTIRLPIHGGKDE